MKLKYWPLIWSALARKPTEGLLTFFAVSSGFTLLALMISMNVTTRELLDHVPNDRLIVDARFPSPTGPSGLPLAMAGQLARLEGIREVAPNRFLGGYHVDPHQSLGIRMVDSGSRDMWPELAITPAQWHQLFSTPTGILVSVKAASKWGIKSGDTFTLTTRPGSRADGQTTWEFQVLSVVPDDTQMSGTFGYMIGNSLYVENTAPLDRRGVDYYFYVRIKDPRRAVEMAERIDDHYANSAQATITVQERFNLLSRTSRGFDTLSLTLAIGGTGFAMVLFLTANAIARSVRERVPEFAVLKTLGYLGGHLMALVFIETAIPCILGAMLGTALAVVLGHWSSHLLPQGLSRMLGAATLPVVPVLSVSIALAIVLALASGALPMLRLRRMSVTDALAGR